MPGPTPKDPALRQRRNKTSTRALLCTNELPRLRAPSLPKLTKNRKVKGEVVEVTEEWHPMARRFWEMIWRSPMTTEFLRADEPALLRLVFLVHQFWKGGSLAVAAEIRMLEREFGMTPMSRRRLEWAVVSTEEAKDRHEHNRAVRAKKVIDAEPDPRGVLDL
jgi:hypothetical protein